MNRRLQNRVEKLEKTTQSMGDNVYLVDLFEDEYFIYDATKRKYLDGKNKNEFEAWCTERTLRDPQCVIILDDIPWD